MDFSYGRAVEVHTAGPVSILTAIKFIFFLQVIQILRKSVEHTQKIMNYHFHNGDLAVGWATDLTYDMCTFCLHLEWRWESKLVLRREPRPQDITRPKRKDMLILIPIDQGTHQKCCNSRCFLLLSGRALQNVPKKFFNFRGRFFFAMAPILANQNYVEPFSTV